MKDEPHPMDSQHAAVLRNVALPVSSRQVGPQAIPVETHAPKQSATAPDIETPATTVALPVDLERQDHASLESIIRAKLAESIRAELSEQLREQIRQEERSAFDEQLRTKLAEQQAHFLQQQQADQSDSQRLEALLLKVSTELKALQNQGANSPVLWDNCVTLASILLGKLLPRLISNPAELQALVDQAIRDLQNDHLLWQNSVTVHLHPQDLKALQTSVETWVKQLETDNIRLQASTQVELGGCVASCSSDSLDLRLETQLEQIKEAILAWRAQAA